MSVTDIETKKAARASGSESVDESVDGGDELHPDEAEVLGNGKSIEDRAAEGEHEEPDDDGSPQLILPGTASGLTTTAGGKKPQSATFKVAAISLPLIGGELKVGDRGWVAVEYEVTHIGIRAMKKGRETSTVVREHTAKPMAVELLDRPLEG